MSMCEACERGDHANCNLASWCECDNVEDGNELACVADNLVPSVEDLAAFREQLDQSQAEFVSRVGAMLDNLSPAEQAIIDHRLPNARTMIANHIDRKERT
jgi:hypothetical protein